MQYDVPRTAQDGDDRWSRFTDHTHSQSIESMKRRACVKIRADSLRIRVIAACLAQTVQLTPRATRSSDCKVYLLLAQGSTSKAVEKLPHQAKLGPFDPLRLLHALIWPLHVPCRISNLTTGGGSSENSVYR